MSKFIEVSHVIEAGMKTYPGVPEPTVEVFLDYDTSRSRFHGQAEFFMASLHLCGNTGTYVDAPCHRYRGAVDLAGLPLDRLADLEAVVIDAVGHPTRGIGPEVFEGLELEGRAVLVRTDSSLDWRTDRYFGPNPFLTAEAADYLLKAGVLFAGIDALNIDDTGDYSRPVHTKLLAAGIPICEHLTNLAAIPAGGGRLHAVPIAWRGGASFPVRAYIVI